VQEKQATKPAQQTNPSTNTTNTTNPTKSTIARPQTPGKRPDKINSETKEVKEEQAKASGKVPQGLISDKNKVKEEEDSKNTVKPKIKDDDLAPTTGGSKIKITSKIGKFADITAGEDGTKSTSIKSFSAADLESIKNYVQDISKNSNPIGKIIDFLGDDVESMNKELQNWIKEAKTYKDRYDEEIK
jgi:hypothetical protein